jgi:hypothetical protein
MSIDEGKQWVIDKIKRSNKKLCPAAREIVGEYYSNVKTVLR